MTMTSIIFEILRNCGSQFKCSYLENEKYFQNLLFDFSNVPQILKISKKIMIVIANVFPKLQTVKDLVRPLSTKHHFRTLFDSNMLRDSKHL